MSYPKPKKLAPANQIIQDIFKEHLKYIKGKLYIIKGLDMSITNPIQYLLHYPDKNIKDIGEWVRDLVEELNELREAHTKECNLCQKAQKTDSEIMY